MITSMAALFVVLLPGIAGTADEAIDKELKRFEGDWQVVAITLNGNTIQGDKLKEKVWRFEGTKLTPLDNREDIATIRLDPATKPAALTITDKGGKIVECIYRFEGPDRLFIGGRIDGQRPKDFNAADGLEGVVLKLERVKKK